MYLCSLFPQPAMASIDMHAWRSESLALDRSEDEHDKWLSSMESARFTQRTSPHHHQVSADDRCLLFVCRHYRTTRSTRLESHRYAYSQPHLSETRTAARTHLFSRSTCTCNTLSHCSTSHSSLYQPTDRWPVRKRRCFSCKRISWHTFIIIARHRRILHSRSLPG